MTIHDISELQKIAKEQGLNFISLVDKSEHKIVPFNKAGVSIDMQFRKILKRFKSSLCEDGEYYILMAENTRMTSQPNRFSILKGKGEKTPAQQVTIERSPEVLTWSSALAMMQQLSDLKSENLFLKKENEFLQKEVAELEAEILIQETAKADTGGLLSANAAAGNFLKDNAPIVISLLDKHFALRERELSLQEKGTNKEPAKQAPGQKRNLEIGSPQHIAIIKRFFNEGKETELNNHLDLLEAKDKEKHDALCVELGITINEPDDEQNGTDKE
jgi:hypothetical protein